MQTRNKTLIFAGILFLFLGIALSSYFLSLGKLRIITCDVGQGDGFLIITPNGKQVVVDGGPGNKMAGCLANNMPFFDRTVEFVLNTHPQEDHLEGLIGVLEAYKVRNVAITRVEAKTGFFDAWKSNLAIEQARIYNAKAGDRVILDSGRSGEVNIEILWPPDYKITSWLIDAPKDLNESSIVFRLNYGQFCAYFTGDITKEILEVLIDKPCQLLKVGHHGSKTGTSEKILSESGAKVALIGVGKNNRYGHPHKEVIDAFQVRGIKILRTDVDGEVEVETDGRIIKIKN